MSVMRGRQAVACTVTCGMPNRSAATHEPSSRSSWTMTSGRQRSASSDTPSAIAGAMVSQKARRRVTTARRRPVSPTSSGMSSTTAPMVAGPIASCGNPAAAATSASDAARGDHDLVATFSRGPRERQHRQQVTETGRAGDEDPHRAIVRASPCLACRAPGPSYGCRTGLGWSIIAATTEEGFYQEWRRDRPVEATTTYRRDVGKVPSPGRCLLRDKGHSLRRPSFRSGRPSPHPGTAASKPGHRRPNMTDRTPTLR